MTLPHIANIGSTPFVERKDLATAFQVPRLFIKDESANLTGTIKDRKALSIVLAHGPDTHYVCITNGNMGYSVAKLVNDKNRIINVIDRTIDASIMEVLEQVSTVIRADLSQPVPTDHLLALARSHVPPDAQLAAVTETGIPGFADLTYELQQHCRSNGLARPTVMVPFGGGELMSSMLGAHHIRGDNPHARTEELSFYTAGVTTRAGLPEPSRAQQLTYWPLEKDVPDKLRTEYLSTENLQRVLLRIKQQRAELITGVKNEEVAISYNLLQQHDIKSEPSAAVAFAGLWRKRWKPDDIIIVINTGEGVYNKQQPFPKAN